RGRTRGRGSFSSSTVSTDGAPDRFSGVRRARQCVFDGRIERHRAPLVQSDEVVAAELVETVQVDSFHGHEGDADDVGAGPLAERVDNSNQPEAPSPVAEGEGHAGQLIDDEEDTGHVTVPGEEPERLDERLPRLL